MRIACHRSSTICLLLLLLLQRSLQSGLGFDLNELPPPEINDGQSVSLHLLENQSQMNIDRTTQNVEAKRPPSREKIISNKLSHDRHILRLGHTSMKRLTKDDPKLANEMKEKARMEAKQVARQTGHPRGSEKYKRLYKSVYEKSLRISGFPSRPPGKSNPDVIDRIRQRDKIRGRRKRAEMRQRKENGEMTPQDLEHYKRGRERAAKSRERRNDRRQEQQQQKPR